MTSLPGETRKWFLDAKPPPNYVAGISRGATGFTTRSDLGPATITTTTTTEPPPGFKGKEKEKEQDLSDAHYDSFSGYTNESLWDSVPYDEEDEKADEVWESIDEKISNRRKNQREARIKEQISEYRKRRPKIQDMLSDLREDLKGLGDKEWNKIPDKVEQRARKRKEEERYTPVPDSLIQQALAKNQEFGRGFGGEKDEKEKMAKEAAMLINEKSSGKKTTDLTQLGKARGAMLSMSLQKVSNSIENRETQMDSEGYLTSLSSTRISTTDEVSDIKRARLLFRSVTKTNPTYAPGWIAAARLEELAGKLVTARKVILKGCNACANSEDIWLEAARLHPPKMAKSIIATACRHLPKSVNIWCSAADLEEDLKNKKEVLKMALDFIPNSVQLWKEAVALEEPENARILLHRAVECSPQNVELWLALARLETYENAQIVLNRAREALPAEPLIWINAAMLQEANAHSDSVAQIVSFGIETLLSQNVAVNREVWMREAENCERAGFHKTSKSIIRAVLKIGVEEEYYKITWLDDARAFVQHGSIKCARAIYSAALQEFRTKKSVYLAAIQFERRYGDPKKLQALLASAVENCPKFEIFWLMYAKILWNAQDIDGARNILGKAFKENPDSDNIWLAAVKLEKENTQYQRARKLLENARSRTNSVTIWIKSIKLERDLFYLGVLKQRTLESQLISLAVKKFPFSVKIHFLQAKFFEQTEDVSSAREAYRAALKNCPKAPQLWIQYALLEEKFAPNKARSIFENARVQIPDSEEIWYQSISFERRTNNEKIANFLMEKALQNFPQSGILWADCIEHEKPELQKARTHDALSKCDKDPYVMTTAAKMLAKQRLIDEARSWFLRTITEFPDYGDAWVFYYIFESRFSSDQNPLLSLQKILEQCVQVQPSKGVLWASVSKNAQTPFISTKQILLKLVEQETQKSNF